MTDEKSIRTKRDYFVIKGNDLVRYARYQYTTQQLKIFNYAVSKIRKNDNPGKWYELSIEELCKICGLAIDSGGVYYRNIKTDLRKLTERRWVTLPDREITISVLSDAQIIPLSGTVYIKFHEYIEPYLFEQLEKYTQYKLSEILSFHSKYSIRLYEVLKSYITTEEIENGKEVEHTFQLQELREILSVDKYKIWGEFERNVLKIATREINEYSDQIQVSYDTMRHGKTVTQIHFVISGARHRQIMNAHEIARTHLDGNADRERKRNAEKTVQDWLQLHPNGNKKECMRETGLSKYLVQKYWLEEMSTRLETIQNKYIGPEYYERIKEIHRRYRRYEQKKKELEKKAREEIPAMIAEIYPKTMFGTEEKKKAAKEDYDALNNFMSELTITLDEIEKDRLEIQRKTAEKRKKLADKRADKLEKMRKKTRIHKK